MTADAAPPLIEIERLVKHYTALRPLRIASLRVNAADRLSLGGFDAGAAELFIHLVTGAAIGDEGTVRISGRDTREIATDTEWLRSLDRFGVVTERAVLLDGLSVAANLALPLSLSIDPMPPELRDQVAALAQEVRLQPAQMDQPVSALSAEDRVRVHLARALASRPEIVLLEHPTARLSDADASARIGETVRAVADARRMGWIALTEDQAFDRAAAGTRLTLVPATGELKGSGWLKRFLKREGT